jgi:hypothetical protein
MLSGSKESAAIGKPYGEGSFPLIAGCFATAQHDTSCMTLLLFLPNISELVRIRIHRT